MLTLLNPTGKDSPYILTFSLQAYTFEELVEDLQNCVEEPDIKNIHFRYSPKNGFEGLVTTGRKLTTHFINTYEIKHLQK